jgi:hypothetical protein
MDCTDSAACVIVTAAAAAGGTAATGISPLALFLSCPLCIVGGWQAIWCTGSITITAASE